MIKIANNLKYMIAKKTTDKPEAEELVGDQDKLDLNKNKRLDAQDFKMIRSKKSDDDADHLKYLKERQGQLNKNYVQDDAITGGLGGLALGGLGGAAYEHFRAPNEDGSEKDYLKSILMGGGIGLGVGGVGGAAYGSQTGESRRYESSKAEMKANKKWNPDANDTKQEEEYVKKLKDSLGDPQTKIKNQKEIDDLEKSMADKAKATKAK